MIYKLHLDKAAIFFIIILVCPMVESLGKNNKANIGALPPKYLMVKDFKKCLGTKQKDTFQYYCIPDNKPELCSKDSWKQLVEMDLPPC